MRVVVTRPAREAAQWVDRLRKRGIAAISLPLIAIEGPPDADAVRSAWEQLARFDALMFVSPNAVARFFEARPQGLAWTRVRAWAPGRATRQALLEAGVPVALVDAPPDDAAQFDSEALWAQVQGQAGAARRVLLVRGADAGGRIEGRDWLARQLEAVGTAVESLACYRRALPHWDAGGLACAAEAADGGLWLFSSSEAIGNLRVLMPQQAWGAARAVATHPRIAQAARDAGFGEVRESRPAFEDVCASIESTR